LRKGGTPLGGESMPQGARITPEPYGCRRREEKEPNKKKGGGVKRGGYPKKNLNGRRKQTSKWTQFDRSSLAVDFR